MNFLGVGYQEIIVVLVLMLIFVGPERMPTVAYQIGRAVRTMQKYARAVRDEFGDEIGFIEEQVRTVKGEVETTRSAMRDGQASFQADLNAIAPAPLGSLLGTDPLGLVAAAANDGPASVSEPASVAPETAASPVPQPTDERPSSVPLVF